MSTYSTIRIEEYSDKAFCVRGPTKPFKQELKDLGGRWNPNLKGGEGWIFRNVDRDAVDEWFDSLVEDACVKVDDAPSTPNIRHRAEMRAIQKAIDDLGQQVDMLKSLMNRKADPCSWGRTLMYAAFVGALVYIDYGYLVPHFAGQC